MTISVKQALVIRRQIINGEWKAEASFNYSFDYTKATCYEISRKGLNLWVANSIFSLSLRTDDMSYFTNLHIPFLCKIIIWFPAKRIAEIAELQLIENKKSENECKISKIIED